MARKVKSIDKSIALLKSRRTERYLSFIEKVKSIIEEAVSYKDNKVSSILSDTWEFIKESTIKDKVYQSEGSSTYYYWLDIKPEDKENFAKKVISGLEMACAYMIDVEVQKERRFLCSSYLNDDFGVITPHTRSKCSEAILTLVEVVRQRKNKELKFDFYEIKKDIVACIDYNSTIHKKELSKQPSLNIEDKIADDFIENIIANEDKELEMEAII